MVEFYYIAAIVVLLTLLGISEYKRYEQRRVIVLLQEVLPKYLSVIEELRKMYKKLEEDLRKKEAEKG